ncbi:hypothetical protein [Sandarakinorhabdus sp.]|jgi:hypothetical protein|nr:hypothetical protein [Sandarakinorhabdus sp.]
MEQQAVIWEALPDGFILLLSVLTYIAGSRAAQIATAGKYVGLPN